MRSAGCLLPICIALLLVLHHVVLLLLLLHRPLVLLGIVAMMVLILPVAVMISLQLLMMHVLDIAISSILIASQAAVFDHIMPAMAALIICANRAKEFADLTNRRE
jgi:hypothetical protein